MADQIRGIRQDIQAFIEARGLKVIDGDIQPGDLYVAARNTEPQLLTCMAVDDRGWIIPHENAYCFDTWECVRVRIV